MSHDVERKLVSEGITFAAMDRFINQEYKNAVEFRKALSGSAPDLEASDLNRVVELSERRDITVNTELIKFEISEGWFTREQSDTLSKLNGRSYKYSWELRDELEAAGSDWKMQKDTPGGRHINRSINSRLDYLYKKFWVTR